MMTMATTKDTGIAMRTAMTGTIKVPQCKMVENDKNLLG
jgi:hypothetical protein